jgi:hypothetical protein
MNCEEAYMELVFWSSVLYLEDFWFCGCEHDDVNVSLSSIRWDASIELASGNVKAKVKVGKTVQWCSYEDGEDTVRYRQRTPSILDQE